MSEKNKQELQVAALKNGTVIDHIPSDKLFTVVALLGLQDSDSNITIGNNFESKKLGKKGIIKVADRFFTDEEISRLSVVAPNVKLNIIRDYEVVEKKQVLMPEELRGIVKCANPKCITNNEPMTTLFHVIDKEHGILKCHYCEKCISAGKAFIDLGADFRLESEEEYTEWYGGTFLDKKLHEQAVYGLPEFFRDKIKGKKLIANPGCYTTCSPLAIAPAIANGLVSTKGIICDCKSGVTGAGRKPTQGNHFPELNEGFHAYKVACHRHTPEIEQTLSKLSGEDVTITFVPHLLPVNRGILATVYADINEGVTFEQIRKAYEDFYKDEFFVRLLDDGKCADIHNVRYSNFCDVSIHHDKRANKLVACAAIDNMVKGAAGQAIQNMNIIFGLDEKTGLIIVPPAF